MIKENSKIKILFIVNPFSGLGRQKAIETHIQRALNHDKFHHEMRYTQGPLHATELSQKGVEDGFDVIVAVGGDGTVNEVAAPLIKTDVMLGIVPSGSGNGLARYLRIPLEPEQAIRVLNGLRKKKIDTMEANGRVFLSIAGVGFDAFVAKKFAGQKRRGFFKYAQIAVTEYFTYRPGNYTLQVDGKSLRRNALFISFANSDQFGYNTAIAPNAKIDDGMMDICIMKKFPLWQSVILAPLLFTHHIDRSPYIEIIRAKKVNVRQAKSRINLDGEPVKMSQKLHIRVIPKSLAVVIP